MKPFPPLLSLGSLLLSAAFAARLFFHPIASSALLPTGNILHGWAAPWLHTLFFPLLLLALGWGFVLRKKTPASAGSSPLEQLVFCLRPLAWLPALAWASSASEWIGLRPAALVLPFGSALVLAFSLHTYLSLPEPASAPSPKQQTRAFALACFLTLFALSFAVFPVYEGGGDVKHYRNQTQNLLQYGTLNLRPQFPDIAARFDAMPPAQAASTSLSHIRTNARGQLFSYHSFGTPLLSLPFEWALGSFGEKTLRLLLALFLALGCRAVCLGVGVKPRFANTFSFLLTLSYPWLLYSLAYLPEGIGCAFVAWAFWGIVVQKNPQRRWTASLACAACCALLPLFHIRFLPPAGMLALFFGLEGLLFCPDESLRRKLPRLALFSVLCFLGWGFVYACQQYMFSYPIDGAAVGKAYNYKNILFQQPIVMWAALTNQESLGSTLPVLFWLLSVTLLFPFLRLKDTSRHALYAALTTAAILITCNTTDAALGGACIPGRYLLQAVSVLLPFGALALQRSDAPARLWCLFLTSLSVLLAFVVLVYYDVHDMNRILRIIPIIEPLHNFWMPGTLYCKNVPQHPYTLQNIFYLLLFLLTGCGFLPMKLRLRAIVLPLLAVLALGVGLTGQARRDATQPPDSSAGFHFTRHANWTFFKADNRTRATTPTDFFVSPETTPYSITLTGNAAKDLAWASAMKRASAPHSFNGAFGLHLAGTIEAGSTLLLNVFQGSHERYLGALPEGPFDLLLLVPTKKGWGDTYLHVALQDNLGKATLHSSDMLPLTPGMLSALPALSPKTKLLHIP